MKNKTLKFMCKVLCLVLVASFVLEAPLMAAMETIPVSVGGQQFQVTPGQWVSVRQGTQIVHYNVRYVNGRPVALEMSQYVKLIFGEASTAAATAGSTGATAQSGSTSQNSGSTGKTSVSNTGSTGQSSTSNTSGNSSTRQLPARDPVTGRFVKSSGSNTTPSTPATTDSSAVTSGQSTTPNTTSGQTTRQLPARDPVTGRFVKSSGSTTGTPATTDAGSVSTGNSPANAGSSIQNGNVDVGTVADAPVTDGSMQASTRKPFDPAAHPRDPETGRFIKRDSATTGQTGQAPADPALPADSDGIALPSGDANGAGQAGQGNQSGQSSQGGQVGDQAGQVGQTGDQSGQSGQSGQATEGQPGFKDKIAGKFQSGYETGKAMTNQGFQNVKDSLKSGFSAKNILVTAGITVGVDLATQIMRGEKPSAKKALKTVCSAEFAGGVVGSVTGAAAGSFFVPFLSAVPVVGGFLGALAPTFGSIVGGSVGSYLAGDLKNGRFSLRQAFKQIDWIGVAGQTVGSTVGAMLGSAIFPPFGTIIGGMVGGYVGNWAAHKIAGVFGKDNQNNTVVAMPTGSNPLGGQTSVNGPVTIGDQTGQTSGSVSGNQDVLTIPGDSTNTQIGTYESEVQLAYARYQELYNLYNELVKQGRDEDAKKIVVEMNSAKAAFDKLKTQGSK
ncbi:MAG TPA: hypothetical protein VIV61_08175 [Candidatus Ozemobacteraceae bacterium]